MDIEGAEFEVLEHLLKRGAAVCSACRRGSATTFCPGRAGRKAPGLGFSMHSIASVCHRRSCCTLPTPGAAQLVDTVSIEWHTLKRGAGGAAGPKVPLLATTYAATQPMRPPAAPEVYPLG